MKFEFLGFKGVIIHPFQRQYGAVNRFTFRKIGFVVHNVVFFKRFLYGLGEQVVKTHHDCHMKSLRIVAHFISDLK